LTYLLTYLINYWKYIRILQVVKYTSNKRLAAVLLLSRKYWFYESSNYTNSSTQQTLMKRLVD